MSFLDDIQGQNTQLYPIVRIGTDIYSYGADPFIVPDEGHYQYYSTNNVNITEKWAISSGSERSVYCRPILMNIPSIKESIDIESRKFKVSNVLLEFNNFPFDGVRFSDQLSETSLINTEVNIYFKSPSTDEIPTGLLAEASSIDVVKDFIQIVYQGIIRRVSHDDTKVKIELEDLTEKKAHKNLPQEYLSDEDYVPDKYKNKIIPFVYGEVDNSPSIYTFSSEYTGGEGADYNLIFGDKISFHTRDIEDEDGSISGLKVIDNNKYVDVLDEANSHRSYTMEDTVEIGNKIYDSMKLYKTYGDQDFSRNYFSVGAIKVVDYIPLINGKAIAGTQEYNTVSETTDVTQNFSLISILLLPVQIISNIFSGIGGSGNAGGIYLDDGTEVYPEPNSGNLPNSPQTFSFNNIDVFKSTTTYTFVDSFNVTHTESGAVRKFSILWSLQDISQNAREVDDLPLVDKYSIAIECDNISISTVSGAEAVTGGTIAYKLDARFTNDELGYYNTNIFHSDSNESLSGLRHMGGSENVPQHLTLNLYGFPEYDGITNNSNNYGVNCDLSVNNLKVQVHYTLDALKDKELSRIFYADVRGRTNTFDDHPELLATATTSTDLISGAVAWFIQSEFFAEASINIQGWAMAFPSLPANETSNLYNYIIDINPDVSVDFSILDNPLIENPIDIIYDLVRSELGHDAIDEDEYAEAKLAHADWKFGFTVNKKINSKKLIEGIAKSTKCFPKFKNDGTFGFNTIKDSYTVEGEDSDYANATLIKESEVISYSFKKTSPEKIYKRVNVKYNKDYAQDSLLSKTDTIVNGSTTLDGAVYLTDDQGDIIYRDDFYGIETSKEAYLEFESDYIRDETTADALNLFLSDQYRNDHLIFRLKLPLKYINLQIGSLVKFAELFDGLKAYGINYTLLDLVNFQWRYPLFMITACTKNLDSVYIECMQLHALETIDSSEWQEELPDLDTTTPSISIGQNESSFNEGDAFIPFTATATDDVDGVIPVLITYSNSIPTDAEAFGFYNTPGDFTVFYTATDSSGNSAFGSSNVTVHEVGVAPPTDDLIYPSLVTELGSGGYWEGVSQIVPYSPDKLRALTEDEYSGNGSEELVINFLEYPDIFIVGNYIQVDGTDWGNAPLSVRAMITSVSADMVEVDYDSFIGLEGTDFSWIYSLYPIEIWAVNPSFPLDSFTLLGDSNLDGVVNVLDVVQTVNYILGNISLESQSIANIDANQDGLINVLDVVQILNMALD